MNDSSQFDYSQHIFKEIKDIVYKKSGINLSGKYELVHARLLKRLHTIDLNSFPKYMQLVTTDESELMEMINAITTNVTHFFREQYQLETLANELCPIILEKKGRIDIWSAGCSTGQEPYSIAITLEEKNIPYNICASDLDSKVLATAKSGQYNINTLNKIPVTLRKKWFKKCPNNKDYVNVSKTLQNHIIFKQLNLMNDWNYLNKVDIIFCRNVVIYFDDPTKKN